MPGKDFNALLDVAVGQYGYVTTQDATDVDVALDTLRKMATRGTVERVARGLYRFPAVATTGLDQYMEATLWPHGGGVLSHDTALDLHTNARLRESYRVARADSRERVKRGLAAARTDAVPLSTASSYLPPLLRFFNERRRRRR